MWWNLRFVCQIRNYDISSNTGSFLEFFRMILHMTSDLLRLSVYHLSCITKPNTFPLLHTTLLTSIDCCTRSYSLFCGIDSLLEILGKSTQIKIETGVDSHPSIFEIKPSNFVFVTVNNRTQGSPISMLQNLKMKACRGQLVRCSGSDENQLR